MEVTTPSRCIESAARPSADRHSTHVSPEGASASAMADQPRYGPYVGPSDDPPFVAEAMNMRPSCAVQSSCASPLREERSTGIQVDLDGNSRTSSRPPEPRNSSEERPSPFCHRTWVSLPHAATETAVQVADSYPADPGVHEPSCARIPNS